MHPAALQFERMISGTRGVAFPKWNAHLPRPGGGDRDGTAPAPIPAGGWCAEPGFPIRRPAREIFLGAFAGQTCPGRTTSPARRNPDPAVRDGAAAVRR
jgi:hypothetical protein